jgi:hypothetical protein
LVNKLAKCSLPEVYIPKNIRIKKVGITMTDMNFCQFLEVFFFGNQSSNLKIRQKKVKKLITKTGITKMDFKSLFLDLNTSKNRELKIAKNDGKSPYQAKAILDRIDVTKRMRKTRVLFLSGVLKRRSKE